MAAIVKFERDYWNETAVENFLSWLLSLQTPKTNLNVTIFIFLKTKTKHLFIFLDFISLDIHFKRALERS